MWGGVWGMVDYLVTCIVIAGPYCISRNANVTMLTSKQRAFIIAHAET